MWHKFDDINYPVPRDRPFPAIDDAGKFCFIWRIGDEIIGSSVYNWEYHYRPGILRQSNKLKITAWYEVPAYEPEENNHGR